LWMVKIVFRIPTLIKTQVRSRIPLPVIIKRSLTASRATAVYVLRLN
jgi:hypothetical protein